jgi:hypothetical protein
MTFFIIIVGFFLLLVFFENNFWKLSGGHFPRFPRPAKYYDIFPLCVSEVVNFLLLLREIILIACDFRLLRVNSPQRETFRKKPEQSLFFATIETRALPIFPKKRSEIFLFSPLFLPNKHENLVRALYTNNPVQLGLYTEPFFFSPLYETEV